MVKGPVVNFNIVGESFVPGPVQNVVLKGADLLDSIIAKSNSDAGTPIGSLTPTAVGELYFDTTAQIFYIATGTSTTSDWVELASSGGVSANLTHHAYPWLLRRDTGNHVEDSPGFFDRESVLHYPGWTVSEDTTGTGGNQNTTMDHGEELDGLSPSRRTTFWEVDNLNTEEGFVQTWDLRTAVPEGFTSWGANGIILRHKIGVGNGAGNGTDTGVITIEVFDPTTASDTVAASANRTRTSAEADDTTYQDVQITGATLNGITNPHIAGELLHLRVELSGAFVEGAFNPTFRVGRLSAFFE